MSCFTVSKGIDTVLSTETYWCRWNIAFTDESLKIRITHLCRNVDRGTVANQEVSIRKAGTSWNSMRSLARRHASAKTPGSSLSLLFSQSPASMDGSRSEDYCRSCITFVYCMCPWHIPESLYACSGIARSPRTILFVHSETIHSYTDDHLSSVSCRHRVRKRSQDSFYFSVWD